MHGLIRAGARLIVMAAVMAAVLMAALAAGLSTTTAIAIGIVLSGLAGLGLVSRRPRGATAAQQIEAMMAAPAEPARQAPAAPISVTTAVEAMAPPESAPVDPEALMPRWRRPSLLEARRSDPMRQAPSYRLPSRFLDDQAGDRDIRTVRYAVVAVLDRPDEVLGLRLSDLASGDEVQVLTASNAFLEVLCPTGERGWIHRTTVGPRVVADVGMPAAAPAVVPAPAVPSRPVPSPFVPATPVARAAVRSDLGAA